MDEGIKKTLNIIAEAVCQAANVSFEQLRSYERSLVLNTARGVYYLIAFQKGIHPTFASSIIGRTRCSCIITTKMYRNYYYTKDRITLNLYSAVKEILGE